MATYVRQSPLHALLEDLNPEWVEVQDMPVPKRFGDPGAEKRAVQDLALADVSALRKFGVKGPGAAAWLRDEQVPVPDAIYDWRPMEDAGGKVIKVSGDEFLLEDGLRVDRVSALKKTLGGGVTGAYPVERQDAGFFLCGSKAPLVLAQTCSVDFDREPEHLVMSRVAGVSCAILPARRDAFWVFRIWCPPSFAYYLGEQLLDIARELGGAPVGLDSIEDII